MPVKQRIDLIVEDVVAQGATEINQSAIIPDGKILRLITFGGYERMVAATSGIIALQFGSGAAWQTIRVGGGGVFEFELNKNYFGDGVKRFRLVRQNKDPVGSVAKEMVAWVEAVVL
jgi:hypothetical protein